MKKTAIYFLLLLNIACVPKKGVKSNADAISENINSEVEIEIEAAENVMNFRVINKTDSIIHVFNYQQLHIEREVGNDWEKLRILPCPCGAPCVKPSEYIEVLIGNHLDFIWNLEESWCGERNETPIPETLTSPATPGKYRIKILYSHLFKDQQIIYKEFNL